MGRTGWPAASDARMLPGGQPCHRWHSTPCVPPGRGGRAPGTEAGLGRHELKTGTPQPWNLPRSRVCSQAAPRARAIAAIWPPTVVQGRMSRSRPVRTGRILSAPEAYSAHTGSQPLARSPSSCGSVPCTSVNTHGSRSGSLRRRFSGSLRATARFSWPGHQLIQFCISHANGRLEGWPMAIGH
jgi:hypothetical protein